MTHPTSTRAHRRSLLLALVLGICLAPAAAFGADAGTNESESSEAGEEAGEIRFVLLGVDAEQGGVVRCALYRNEGSWLDQSRRYKRSSARVRGRQAACVFRGVPAGTYGIAALHDADGDSEMDRSLVGIPQEGYAISRNEHDRLSRPDFDEAAIQFDGGRLVTRARMKY